MNFHERMRDAWARTASLYEAEPPRLPPSRRVRLRCRDGRHELHLESDSELAAAIAELHPIWIRALTRQAGRYDELAFHLPDARRAMLALRVLRDDLGIRYPEARVVRHGAALWVVAAGRLGGIDRAGAERILDRLDGRGFRSEDEGQVQLRYGHALQQALLEHAGGTDAAGPEVRQRAEAAARAATFPAPHRAFTLDAAWYPLPGSWNLLDGQRTQEVKPRGHAQ